MIAGGECLKPLSRGIKKFTLSHGVVHADETFIEVHKGTGKAPVSENYMWVAALPEWSKNDVYFEYQPCRSSRAASFLLEGLKSHLHVDAYKGYDGVCKENGLIRVGCWAHVPRHFEKENTSGANSRCTLSEKILKDIKKLFMLERELKELSTLERKSNRENKAPPILKRIKEKLDKNLDEVPPKSKLREAIHYIAKEWPHREHFAHNGELALCRQCYGCGGHCLYLFHCCFGQG
jgi:transposase